jgi:xanthine dehydrogenase accessory factor
MNELPIWEFLHHQLQTESQVGLMIVVQSEGSSPGRRGFKMAVARDGTMLGSIGGGIMEHKLVEFIRNKLAANEPFWEFRKQVHSKDVPRDQSGMICSGTQWLAILSLGAEQKDTVREIIACLNRGDRVHLYLNQSGLHATPGKSTDSLQPSEISVEEEWQYGEALGMRDTVHVIGAGHVGLAMCKVMKMLDFQVVNYDDRPGLNTMQANDHADQKIVIPYTQLDAVIEGGEDVYVIVMTFGYRGDDQAIRALLGKKFAYLGMMGSETKVAKLLHGLNKDGFDADQIASIHTPAGLTIHCKTPIEIAVSIAAEIIAVKNNRQSVV